MSYVPLPTVYEREGRTERAWDIYSRLLRIASSLLGLQLMTLLLMLLLSRCFSPNGGRKGHQFVHQFTRW